MLKSYKIYTCANGSLGLHLSRAPWDPYPWVSSIQKDSTSYQAGLRIGDCLLELNGQDVLGMKISEIAALLKNHWLNESSNYVTAVIWRNKNSNTNGNSENATTEHLTEADDDDEDEENNTHNINQQSLQKFATCLQHIAQLLECPVCLEVIKPPGWQCCNGHVLCNNCRSRSEKCPVCRVPLGPRGRCLLSDKLFTLLADSFPCDGVRSNRNSPKDRRKCSQEFHNQPKMAIVQKQQEQPDKDVQQGAKKAKESLFTSLRQHRSKICNYKMSENGFNEESRPGATKEDNKNPSIQKQAISNKKLSPGIASTEKRNSCSRKSSPDCSSDTVSAIIVEQSIDANVKGAATSFRCDELQEQISTIQQCHCVTCFKPDRAAVVNNVATIKTNNSSAALNKYILRISSQGQLENGVHQQCKQQQCEEIYKSYQCPTGKLCCLNVNANVMHHEICPGTGAGTTTKASDDIKIPFSALTTNNSLSRPEMTTKQTAITAGQQNQLHDHYDHHHHRHYHQFNGHKFHKILKTEWDILAHITVDHQLPVNQYYAEYGQRILVQSLIQQQSIACLNLKGSEEYDAKVEKFFIACIPLEMSTMKTFSKVAIFVYHFNSLGRDNNNTTITSNSTSFNDEVSNFETIIENPITGIKWFGRAHPLTTPWSDIHGNEHFFRHNVSQSHLVAVSTDGAAFSSCDDAFVIVVKRKLELKTKT